MLPGYVTGADLTDAHCVVTQAYNVPPRPSITGFDGSQREWCTVPQANPQMDTSLTHLFLSNTSKLAVGQSRIIRGDKRRFEGVAGFEIELDFFSDWIAQVPIDKRTQQKGRGASMEASPRGAWERWVNETKSF